MTTSALPWLHGHRRQLALGPKEVRVVPPGPLRLRVRLPHLALAFVLVVVLVALLLTVAMVATASRAPSTDDSHPTASAQAAPRPPSFD